MPERTGGGPRIHRRTNPRPPSGSLTPRGSRGYRSGVLVRPGEPADAAAIAAIYNEGIADRQATFETDERGAEDVLGWLGDGAPPLLVADDDGAVVGWARAGAYSDRCAYAGVGEYAVYVARAARGNGVGRA